jgi:hypothetical protein
LCLCLNLQPVASDFSAFQSAQDAPAVRRFLR